MTDPQVDVLKLGLVELFREINSGRLDGALRLAHGWSLEETPTAIHSSGGGVSRPTESAAINGRRKDPTEQVLRSLLESVDQYVRDLVKMSRDTQPISGKDAHAAYKKEYEAVLTLAPCRSILCDDQAPEGHRHCEACAEYLKNAAPGTTQVPRNTILGRKRQRKFEERTKVHVTGPFAEEDQQPA